MLKALVLTFAALCIIEAFTVAINLGHRSVYLFIGAGMNVPGFLALGLAIGYLYNRPKAEGENILKQR